MTYSADGVTSVDIRVGRPGCSPGSREYEIATPARRGGPLSESGLAMTGWVCLLYFLVPHSAVADGVIFILVQARDVPHEDEDGFSAPPQRAGVADWNDIVGGLEWFC